MKDELTLTIKLDYEGFSLKGEFPSEANMPPWIIATRYTELCELTEQAARQALETLCTMAIDLRRAVSQDPKRNGATQEEIDYYELQVEKAMVAMQAGFDK